METKNSERVGFFDGLGLMIREEITKRKRNSTALLFDAIVFVVAFLFSGCHLAFGAYPLGIAFVAVLPRGVWIALIGAVFGSLSIGRTGLIHAIISVIVVFLRIIISGSDRKGEVRSFGEPLVLRVSAAAIGAFVGAVYEILLGGFAMRNILFGTASVLLSSAFTFAFAGIFDGAISLSDFLGGRRGVLTGVKGEKRRFDVYLFEATFLLFVFLLSVSLKRYNLFGVSFAYMFASAITLTVARRFGAVRGMAIGFASTVAVSGAYTVAFSLVGLGAGALFGLGIPYALVAGGALLSLWIMYTGGTMGLLSVFPEYLTGALLSVPVLRKLSPEEESVTEVDLSREARDMVSSAALSYRGARGGEASKIAEVLISLATPLKKLGEGEGSAPREEYLSTVINALKAECTSCPFYADCMNVTPAPCVENVEDIVTKLMRGEALFATDTHTLPRYCKNKEGLFRRISDAVGAMELEYAKRKRMEAVAEEYELISRLISEASEKSEKERYYNKRVSEDILPALERQGLYNASVKVFGERKKHFIIAAEDKDGKKISSPELLRDIEECAKCKLSNAEFYRRGDVALLECDAAARYTVEFATAGKASPGESVSGDTAVSFSDNDGRFYALISDGMGTGEEAHRYSTFTADFLSRALTVPTTKTTALHLLNRTVRSKNEECAVTVDLFELDLLNGEATFFKCGAAPSYVKRDGSIFRLRSETAPLGITKNIDAEKIRVEIKSGDYVVMLSDGISQSTEDATWLLEFLNKTHPASLSDYAEKILALAEKNVKGRDDMSVAVVRIQAV
ncbi:MAG: SpoIIE family protein phosphatase [Clostridia bacterium]|nr:SpoIIE family protein phosphatase [Clostridia bacterium]